MPDYLDHPARKSPRLEGYDYAQDGAYFVTICTQNRAHLFGQIIDQTMQLSPAGQMVVDWWQQLSHKYADEVVARLTAITDPLKARLGPDPDMWAPPGESRYR